MVKSKHDHLRGHNLLKLETGSTDTRLTYVAQEKGHRKTTKPDPASKRVTDAEGGGKVDWRTVPPNQGQPQTMWRVTQRTKERQQYFWCAQCGQGGRWTTNHATADHRAREETEDTGRDNKPKGKPNTKPDKPFPKDKAPTAADMRLIDKVKNGKKSFSAAKNGFGTDDEAEDSDD